MLLLALGAMTLTAAASNQSAYDPADPRLAGSYARGELAQTPWDNLLYPVEVTVVDSADQRMADISVRYDPVPDLGSISAYGANEAVTDASGRAVLYLPLDTACTISAAATRDEGVVRAACSFTATQDRRACTMKIPTNNLNSITFAGKSAGEPLENMPARVAGQGQIPVPNNVPRREGYQFAKWNTRADGSGTANLPGEIISVSGDLTLYAIWTVQPDEGFRIITYDPNGDNVSLPDNPQIYTKEDSFSLNNPTRKDYIFLGWTCGEIGLSEPQKDVTVAYAPSNYVNRTYRANWKHVTYTVSWKNYDGTVLAVSSGLYDDLPNYEGPTPTRPADETYFYRFAGWTPEIKVVSEDTTYTAVFNAYPRLHVTGPEDVTAREGEPAAFQVTASGGVEQLTYQWYVLPAGGTAAPIDGADTARLTLTAAAALDGNRYYCVVKDAVGQEVPSDQATLTIPADAVGYPIALRLSGHGDVRLTHHAAEAGKTVTLVIKPEAGYMLEKLTVTDEKGRTVAVSGQGENTYAFSMPNCAVTIDVSFRVGSAALPFTDVPEHAWYAEAVTYVYTHGLMDGTGPSTFRPAGATSRAMIATMLWHMAGSPVVNYAMDFSDVAQGRWYTEAIRWAASEKIVTGYLSGAFGPDDPITREQLAAMLYRFAAAQGLTVSGADNALSAFADAAQVHAYAREAMEWACGEGIITGTAPTTLSPCAGATRAQAAAMVMRLHEKYVTQ